MMSRMLGGVVPGWQAVPRQSIASSRTGRPLRPSRPGGTPGVGTLFFGISRPAFPAVRRDCATFLARGRSRISGPPTPPGAPNTGQAPSRLFPERSAGKLRLCSLGNGLSIGPETAIECRPKQKSPPTSSRTPGPNGGGPPVEGREAAIAARQSRPAAAREDLRCQPAPSTPKPAREGSTSRGNGRPTGRSWRCSTPPTTPSSDRCPSPKLNASIAPWPRPTMLWTPGGTI